MQTGLNFSDWAVFALYFVIVTAYGFWIYNQKRKSAADTKDYFLAEGSLQMVKAGTKFLSLSVWV